MWRWKKEKKKEQRFIYLNVKSTGHKIFEIVINLNLLPFRVRSTKVTCKCISVSPKPIRSGSEFHYNKNNIAGRKNALHIITEKLSHNFYHR
jgi:hypothetical protein